MAERLVVVGAGGFGRETLDVIDAVNETTSEPRWDSVGVLDDAPSDVNLARLRARSTPFLGVVNDYIPGRSGLSYVIGIGSPTARRKMACKLDEAGLVAATLVHPTATVGSQVGVGAGTVVCAGARVSTNVRLGRHVHLNSNTTVGHDTLIGDFASLNPGSGVSGDCEIGIGVLVGAGGFIMNQLIVGQWATVGACACVIRPVPDNTTVVGVPARPLMRDAHS